MPDPGELVPWWNPKTRRREWREVHPETCRNGHQLVAGVIHLGWRGCLCREGRNGHRVVRCLTCYDVQLLPSCLIEADR